MFFILKASQCNITPLWHPEGCMFLVIRVHPNLVLAREPIHEGHSLKSTCIVDQNKCNRDHDASNKERKLILMACFIEILEINADSDHPILLSVGDIVGNPIHMLIFPCVTRIDELFQFILDDFHDFGLNLRCCLTCFASGLMSSRCIAT